MINFDFFKKTDARTAIVFKNILASFGIKGVSILVSFLLVPITINFLNPAVYGIWLTLISIMQWTSLFDMGFSNGLRNRLTEEISFDNFEKGKSLVSTTYALISIIFFFVGVIAFISSNYIDWAGLLNVSSSYNSDIRVSIQILAICFSMQIILKTIGSVALAYQDSAVSGLIESFGQVLSLFGVLIIVNFYNPNLPGLAFALSLAPVLAYIVFSFYLFNRRYRPVRPSFNYIDGSVSRDIFSLGWQFFVIQISYIVIYQTSNIIISRVSGPESVTEYNVAYKLLNVILMVVTIIITPVWSAFTEAYTKKDIKWMQKSYKKLIRLFISCVVITSLLVLMSDYLYKFWIGSAVSISFFTTITTAIFVLSTVWMNIHSYILNGIGKIKLQLYLSLIGMFFNVPLAFYLGKHIGLEGVILSSVIVNIPWIIIAPIQVRKNISGNIFKAHIN